MEADKSSGPILLVVSNSPELHDPSHRFALARVTGGNALGEVGHLLLAAESVSNRVVVATRNASYNGGFAPLNLADLQENRADSDPHAKELEPKLDYIRYRLTRTRGLSDIKISEFEAILISGGLGGVDDYFGCELLGKYVGYIAATGGIVATNSHGAVALHLAHKLDGSALIRGRRFTCASAAEDQESGLTDIMQVNLSCQLEALLGGILGGIYSKAERSFAPHVVQDGNLITGQNAASAKPLATLVKHKLLERAR
jgi:putative intracellular protease/amidase